MVLEKLNVEAKRERGTRKISYSPPPFLGEGEKGMRAVFNLRKS